MVGHAGRERGRSGLTSAGKSELAAACVAGREWERGEREAVGRARKEKKGSGPAGFGIFGLGFGSSLFLLLFPFLFYF